MYFQTDGNSLHISLRTLQWPPVDFHHNFQMFSVIIEILRVLFKGKCNLGENAVCSLFKKIPIKCVRYDKLFREVKFSYSN